MEHPPFNLKQSVHFSSNLLSSSHYRRIRTPIPPQPFFIFSYSTNLHSNWFQLGNQHKSTHHNLFIQFIYFIPSNPIFFWRFMAAFMAAFMAGPGEGSSQWPLLRHGAVSPGSCHRAAATHGRSLGAPGATAAARLAARALWKGWAAERAAWQCDLEGVRWGWVNTY